MQERAVVVNTAARSHMRASVYSCMFAAGSSPGTNASKM